MYDIIIKNANLPDGRSHIDIACNDGHIQRVEAKITAEAKVHVDANGWLVAPPFVDPHFHMDATLSLGNPRMNHSGTLLEGIALWGELKAIQNIDQIIERALKYCDLAISMGIGAIRTHVDTCDPELKGVQALLEVKEIIKDYLDLQLVAFPQDGVLRDPKALETTLRSLDLGVDVVGGIPHFERTMADGAKSVQILCEIAAERGLMVDMHCDESDDPHSRHIETLASETERLGLQGRVTGSHLTSMHSMDNYYVSKLIDLMVESGVNVIPNPLINIMLQGRHDSYPKRRGQTRVRELRDAGIIVGFGSDCVMDPWYSLGRADMLEVAFMGLHVGQLCSRADMAWCFDAVTKNSAQIMNLEGYGLNVGCKANFNLLQAHDPIEALRLKAQRIKVIRGGKIIAQNSPVITKMFVTGRPRFVDAASYAPSIFQIEKQ